MLKKLRNNKGFTIIEVMIVLAIAGLIILVVLLAVPAVQRNARNTAIKNDASALAGGISEFESNNDGSLPSNSATNNNGNVTFGTSSQAQAQVKVQPSDVVSVGSAPSSAPAAGNIVVVYRYKCSGTTYNGTGDVAANNRSVAIIYSTETSNSVSGHCLSS